MQPFCTGILRWLPGHLGYLDYLDYCKLNHLFVFNLRICCALSKQWAFYEPERLTGARWPLVNIQADRGALGSLQ